MRSTGTHRRRAARAARVASSPRTAQARRSAAAAGRRAVAERVVAELEVVEVDQEARPRGQRRARVTSARTRDSSCARFATPVSESKNASFRISPRRTRSVMSWPDSRCVRPWSTNAVACQAITPWLRPWRVRPRPRSARPRSPLGHEHAPRCHARQSSSALLGGITSSNHLAHALAPLRSASSSAARGGSSGRRSRRRRASPAARGRRRGTPACSRAPPRMTVSIILASSRLRESTASARPLLGPVRDLAEGELAGHGSGVRRRFATDRRAGRRTRRQQVPARRPVPRPVASSAAPPSAPSTAALPYRIASGRRCAQRRRGVERTGTLRRPPGSVMGDERFTEGTGSREQGPGDRYPRRSLPQAASSTITSRTAGSLALLEPGGLKVPHQPPVRPRCRRASWRRNAGCRGARGVDQRGRQLAARPWSCHGSPTTIANSAVAAAREPNAARTATSWSGSSSTPRRARCD